MQRTSLLRGLPFTPLLPTLPPPSLPAGYNIATLSGSTLTTGCAASPFQTCATGTRVAIQITDTFAAAVFILDDPACSLDTDLVVIEG